MKLAELKNLSKEELSSKLASTKEELSKLNYLKRVGQVEKPHQYGALRKTIARIKTLLRQDELAKKG
ncbi:MAG TPA: 50S ribosomal protein L29 [Candidatus Omnitrophota bacterium]|nr:50S ribosomal protein L29 [Candidatus Omnitrophota bacterium]